MGAECLNGRPSPWDSQKQRLRRDGQLLTYRLNTKASSTASPTKRIPRPRYTSVNEHFPTQTDQSPSAVAQPVPNKAARDRRLVSATTKLDNERALTLVAREGALSLTKGHIGGLRGDPFNALPISAESQVASAFDYFAEVYAPFAIRPSLFRTYFQTLLGDEMYFEQTIAFSIAAQNHRRVQDGNMPNAVMLHTNNAITHLKQRLLANDTSDIMILTIMQQAAIQHMVGDHKVFGMHARAIQHLVNLRGGLENLGWDGYVASRVRQILSAWSVMQKTQQEGMVGTIGGLSQGKFTYPTHPFPPALSRKLAKFPQGFRDSALRKELSLQFIDYLDLTLQWVRDESGKLALKTSSQYEILGMPKLSTVERLLATAVQAYVNYTERVEHARQDKVTEQSVQSQVHVLSAQEHITKCDRSLLSWVCLMLRATTSEQTDSWRWANAWLCSIGISRQEEGKLGKLFLPIPVHRMNEICSEESVSPQSDTMSWVSQIARDSTSPISDTSCAADEPCLWCQKCHEPQETDAGSTAYYPRPCWNVDGDPLSSLEEPQLQICR